MTNWATSSKIIMAVILAKNLRISGSHKKPRNPILAFALTCAKDADRLPTGTTFLRHVESLSVLLPCRQNNACTSPQHGPR